MGNELLFIWAVRVGLIAIAGLMAFCIWAWNFSKRPCSHEWEIVYMDKYGNTVSRCKHCGYEVTA